jgi:hypothetical protein
MAVRVLRSRLGARTLSTGGAAQENSGVFLFAVNERRLYHRQDYGRACLV